MNDTKDFYNETAREWAATWYEDEVLLFILKKFI